jgi:predicted DNA-binding transcriptional regulator AlpA
MLSSMETTSTHSNAGRPAPTTKELDKRRLRKKAVQRIATKAPWLLVEISRQQWWKLHVSGRTPLPIYLGTRRPVWIIAELRAWAAAGAPERLTWERMKREGK